jgi:TolA-binding protein
VLPTTSSGATSGRRWRAALARGQWAEILADAERDGVEKTLETASSDDLLALADAARYRRRVDLARASLLAQRRRFPSSPRSLDATFLLGRVEELRNGGRTTAVELYDEYLARAPTGTYAAEALGRKMILTREAAGAASARALAEEYLRRFPEGSHAGAARAIQRVP